MEDLTIKVLIVSSPGILQQVLKGLFGRNPKVSLVGIATGGLTASQFLEKQGVDMVVVDSNIPEGETVELIHLIEREYPDIFSLVITDTSHQLHQMNAAGANRSLKTTDLTSKLDEVLIELHGRIQGRASG